MATRKKFSELDKSMRIARVTLPAYVPSSQNPDEESSSQIRERINKFLKLSVNLQLKLGSSELGAKIQAIGRKYSFELLRLANITRLIREYYFGETRLDDFPREIERRMGVSLLTAQEISRYIRKEIIDWDPWAEYLAKLPKVTAREISTKYPKVAEQEITSGYLQFKERPDDIFAPSIKNWLRDYVLHLGQTGHTSVDRMKYLFYSENTKNLTSTEREKLGTILKSFDDNVPLPIDLENNEVVFDIHETHNMEHGTPMQSKLATGQARNTQHATQESIPPQKPPRESFIKPYSSFSPPSAKATDDKKSPAYDKSSAGKSADKPRPIQNKIPDTDHLRFVNPYPKPVTHEASLEEERDIEMAGDAPIKMMGFSEGPAAPAQPAKPSLAAPPPEARFIPPQPRPPRPKNIIRPLYGIPGEKPEPRIEGNTVDLSGKNE